jgi:hypothetical protein
MTTFFIFRGSNTCLHVLKALSNGEHKIKSIYILSARSSSLKLKHFILINAYLNDAFFAEVWIDKFAIVVDVKVEIGNLANIIPPEMGQMVLFYVLFWSNVVKRLGVTQDCQIMIDMFWNVIIAMNQRCISFCEYFFTYKVHLLYILKFYKPYLILLIVLAFIWPVLFDFFKNILI